MTSSKRNRLTTASDAVSDTKKSAKPKRVATTLDSSRTARSVRRPKRCIVTGVRNATTDIDALDEADREQVLADIVELREALGERDRQQERRKDLHAGEDHAQLLQQPVVAIAELFAVLAIVELGRRALGVEHAVRTIVLIGVDLGAGPGWHGRGLPARTAGHSRPIAADLSRPGTFNPGPERDERSACAFVGRVGS